MSNTEKTFRLAFKALRKEFTAKTKRRFLDDIEGQLEEDEEIWDIVTKQKTEPRYLAVTFDRRQNDTVFSYQYFDFVLVICDRFAGGNGIYKPVNQVRAIQWNGSRAELRKVLRYAARLNPKVNFRRALILPFPLLPVGYRIDTAIHMK